MQTKPTLLVTTSTFPRWESDSEPRFVYDLCIRLVDSFDVLVLAPHTQGTPTYEERDGLRIHRYRYAPAVLEKLAYEGGITANLAQKWWKYLLLPSFFLGQWLAVRRLIKTYPVRVIHAHWLIPQGLVAVIACLNKKSPAVLCTSHGGDLYGLQNTIGIVLKKWVIQHCQAVTVVSKAMTNQVSILAGKKDIPLDIIPMGTDLTNMFVPNPSIQRVPNQLLFVGRLVEKKGVAYLLKALVIVRKSYPDMRLLIAGSGPLQTELESLSHQLNLSEHVDFLGQIEHKALVHFYQKSTLAVFPFIQTPRGDMEGLGLVMVEALGCGCPVVASDLPATRDVICPESGYLVNSANSEALAERILTVINQPFAYQLHPEQFDWIQVKARYTNLIQSLIPARYLAHFNHDQQHLCQ